MSLRAIDHPKGTQAYLDDLTRTFDTRALGDAAVYTVRDPKPVRATYDNVALYKGKPVSGLDVTADVAKADGLFAPASLFDDNRYTFELGHLRGSRYVNFVMRGWSSRVARPSARRGWRRARSRRRWRSRSPARTAAGSRWTRT